MQRVGIFLLFWPGAIVRKITRGNKGNLQFFGSTWQQNEVWHIVFTGMSATLKTIDTDRVTADRLCLERVTY